jgi:hypothetical protein
MALESQQKFSAEPLIDAAAASVASGALLEVRDPSEHGARSMEPEYIELRGSKP